MPITSLRTLARHLDVPERTLRRAASEGLVRGRRVSPRRFEATMREEAYLRGHWPFLSSLRAALRTEPRVRLAVLFGSTATGDEHEKSDVDLLVSLADPSMARVAELTGRLERRIGRNVQLVRLQDAEKSPLLMFDVLREGRVLVDRDGHWPELTSKISTWRRRAAKADTPLLDAMSHLGGAGGAGGAGGGAGAGGGGGGSGAAGGGGAGGAGGAVARKRGCGA